MEFETGRRSTLARLQLSVQGLAGSLNSAKKVLVASTVLTAAFCGAVFGLTLVANEASKESHVTNGLLTTVDGSVVSTSINKGMTSLAELSAQAIAEQDFVTFSQDGADRYMQILGVQSTASMKVINTIVGAFEVTEEGMTFAGDNVVLEASEADKAARKAQCKFCTNGRNANCAMCSNTGRSFLIAGRNPMCAICNNEGRNFQCQVCSNGRNAQCQICSNQGRVNQCKMCTNGRNAQCVFCSNGRNVQCSFCSNGRNGASACDEGENEDQTLGDSDTGGETPPHCQNKGKKGGPPTEDPACGGASDFDITSEASAGGAFIGNVVVNSGANKMDKAGQNDITFLDAESVTECTFELAIIGACYGAGGGELAALSF